MLCPKTGSYSIYGRFFFVVVFFLTQDDVKKQKEKQPATDKNSKKHLCTELNKVDSQHHS